jgi:hypothetical protein
VIALLLLGLASADEGATYERLFGAADAAPAAAAAPVRPAEGPSPWGLAGPAALAAVALAAAWKLKRAPVPKGAGRPLDVVWREALGDRGALVLIDVLDADGERRRLLVGTGGGPPALVADLGAMAFVPVPAAAPEATASVPLLTRAARVVARPAPAPAAAAAEEPLRARPPRLGGASGEVNFAPSGSFAEHAARRGLPC